jgi:hypothetical protein
VPEDRYMDDWNTPIWDIVGSNNSGFYTPDGCYSITGAEEKDPNCKEDCFTVSNSQLWTILANQFQIDQYCLWDYGIKQNRFSRMEPNLEGGPRSYYDGLKYNSIYCNSFAM